MRRELTRVIKEHVDAAAGLTFRCVEGDNGTYYTTSPVAAGDPELCDGTRRHLEGPAKSAPWLPDRVDPEVINRFVRVRSYYEEKELLNYNMQTEVSRPLGISDQIRALIYDGKRFVGWVGVLRTDGGRYRTAQEDMLQGAIPSIRAVLTAADQMKYGAVEDGLFAVMTPEGEIEHASEAFGRWCEEDCRDYLRRRIRDIDASRDRENVQVRRGVEFRILRLDGSGMSVRYLVTVGRPELMRVCPRYWLTERQREIAEYVVAGATSREIAQTLELSPATVKTHMKNAYRRLGVSSRVELMTTLEAAGS